MQQDQYSVPPSRPRPTRLVKPSPGRDQEQSQDDRHAEQIDIALKPTVSIPALNVSAADTTPPELPTLAPATDKHLSNGRKAPSSDPDIASQPTQSMKSLGHTPSALPITPAHHRPWPITISIAPGHEDEPHDVSKQSTLHLMQLSGM